MPLTKVDWVPNDELAVGKGTIQQFSATVGGDRFDINVAPWVRDSWSSTAAK